MQRLGFILVFFCAFSLQAADTQLKLYKPFEKIPDQGMITVLSERMGYCLGQSKRIIREDAWRCVAENKIYDPCFAHVNGKDKQVLCPRSPWNGASMVIHVNKPLDSGGHATLDMSNNFPWAVELASGQRCEAVDAGMLYDNLTAHYLCNNGNYLIGHVQRCNPSWQMLEKSGQGINKVDLLRAWF